MTQSTPLMKITEEQVEQLRQGLEENSAEVQGARLNSREVAILLTVCTEWLHNEQALQQDSEVDDTCTECGTIYDTSDGACPICGSQATE